MAAPHFDTQYQGCRHMESRSDDRACNDNAMCCDSKIFMNNNEVTLPSAGLCVIYVVILITGCRLSQNGSDLSAQDTPTHD